MLAEKFAKKAQKELRKSKVPTELTSFLEDLLENVRDERGGNVATYIPQVRLVEGGTCSA